MDAQRHAQIDEDQETVSSCQEGNLHAFEEIVKKYQKKMLNISYRITGDYDDALEVVQDAFVSAYRNIDRFRGQSRFSTWLCAIVINQSRNRVRRIRMQSRRERLILDDPVENSDGFKKYEPASNDLTALERLEKRERNQRIQECIDALGDEFRETLVLRDIQGFSYEEIGDMMKIAAGTVKSRLSRARETLRECLKRNRGD